MSSRLLAATAAMALLAACATRSPPLSQAGSMDPAMGEAVKYNAAIQTINPDPIYPPTAAQPGDSGAKGAAAVRRYRTDQVKQPESPASTTTKAGTGTPR